jgi:hypothetical protein
VDSGHPDLLATYPNAHSRPSLKLDISSSHRTVVTDPEILRRNLSIHRDLATCYCLEVYNYGLRDLSRQEHGETFFRYPNPEFPKFERTSLNRSRLSPWVTSLVDMTSSQMGSTHSLPGIYQGKVPTSCHQDSRIPIPDFPKWVISRHVASVNRTVQIYPGVSTMENPDLLSPGLPIPRFPISRNGRSYDTWPPSIGRLRSIRGFHHGKSRTLVNRNPDSAIPDFPKWEIYDTWPPLIGRLRSISGVFSPLYTGVLTLG